jgi:hypothetical protein
VTNWSRPANWSSVANLVTLTNDSVCLRLKHELERSPSDSLRQALEKLAKWIQEVVHRVIGRGSAQTSHQNPNAENRP